MNAYRRVALAAMLPLVAAAGCNDFLTGGELENDPNRPVESTAGQLLVAVTAATWTVHTGETARAISMWMQQMAGTDRQYQTLGTYEITESGFETPWVYIYGGGGLIDIRKIQEAARAGNDGLYLGIAQVYEALQMGTAADLFGDVPYSEAGQDIAEPKLDPQLEVYARVQAVLDSAIVNLNAGGAGPGALDLVYGGSRTRWVALAHTLKARFYLHVAEVDPSAYAKARTEAALGISSNAGNFTTKHPGTPGERNLWYQFMVTERLGYITPGEYIISLMNSRSDPRLPRYFTQGSGGVYRGAPPGAGFDAVLYSDLSPTRKSTTFAQPIVTYDENLLIWAEAAYKTGDEVTALLKLNEERVNNGLSPVVLAGPALFQEIMLEKYIAMFQTIEVWNDWKRTCIPDITPALGAPTILARLLYPTGERQTNSNVPDPAQQSARNPNDPANPGCNGQN